MCMSQEEKDGFQALVAESEETKTIAQKLLQFVQANQETSRRFRVIVGGGFVEEAAKT